VRPGAGWPRPDGVPAAPAPSRPRAARARPVGHPRGRAACVTAVGGLCLLLGLVPGPLPAQVVPDPGQLQRDLLRDRERFEERLPEDELPEGPVLEAPDQDLPLLPDADVRFLLRGVRFTESALIPEAELRAIAREFIGREVTFGELNELTRAINEIYAREGIVTGRAIIPPQRIEDGVVEVLLVEGELGELLIEGNAYLRDGHLRRRLPVTPGEVIDPRALEAALLRYNRTRDARLSASLAAGDEFGESNVRVQVDEPPRWVGQLSVDNNGAPSTGEEQGGLLASVWSPLGFGDRATAFVGVAEGSRNGDFLYAFPVNRWGGRLELRYAVSDIEVVDGPLRELDIDGDSQTVRGRLAQPLTRGERWWTDAFLGAERLTSESTLDAVEFSDNTVDEVFVAARLRDRGPGAGRFGYQWSVSPRVGYFSAEDILGNDEDGLLLGLGLDWQQRLGDAFFGTLTAEGQYADDPDTVPSARLFRVGGATTVRGYEDGIIVGERGYYASAQVNWRVRGWATPFAFVDYGHVEPVDQESESITGIGAGVFLRWGQRLSGELAYGYAVDEVVPDQDEFQIHVRAVLQFGPQG